LPHDCEPDERDDCRPARQPIICCAATACKFSGYVDAGRFCCDRSWRGSPDFQYCTTAAWITIAAVFVIRIASMTFGIETKALRDFQDEWEERTYKRD
jgi:hypothetical protein